MQFIPSTWTIYRTDGNRDGRSDPFNIFDAAAAAGHYLRMAGGNLATNAGQVTAVLAYTDLLTPQFEAKAALAAADPILVSSV